MTVMLQDVRQTAGAALYPRHVLDGCETALVLFAAAFHGRQDAVWVAAAGLTATCVDTDHEKLGDMVRAYPEGWEFVHGDAYDYALTTQRRWDVVSLDPFTNQFVRCAQLLPLWCKLARRAVVLGSSPTLPLEIPAGWELTSRWYRSEIARWAVIERC